MKLKEWKELYPTTDKYYDEFTVLPEGQKVWSLAHDAMQEDWNEESEEEEPVIIALDIVMDGLESWVLNDVEADEWDNASEWFETMREELSESVFGGLT